MKNLRQKYMYQLVESLKIKNGIPQNLYYHQFRFNKARKDLFGFSDIIDLENIIFDFIEKAEIKNITDQYEICKCRILYSKQIDEIQIDKYIRRQVNSLKIIHNNEIEYNFKFANRTLLTELFSQKGDADDILIVKNGFITDTSYSNIALYDGNSWFTPNSYLLPGTQRHKLLEVGILKEIEVTEQKLFTYKKLRIINAMIDFDDCIDIEISNIIK
ncbi:MAG: aminotransferase class IV [Bacteroidales bacterium]|nr:aminotransferase class IV [Bacteroidales bacterium]